MSRSRHGNSKHSMAIAFKTRGEYATDLLQLAKRITLVEGKRGLPMGALTVIANMVGLSRERVRQLSNKLKIAPYHQLFKETLYHLKCLECKKEMHPTSSRRRFCSKKCWYDYRMKRYFTTYKCKICGKEKSILKSKLAFLRPRFCSKYCQGIWLSRQGRTKRGIRIKLRALVARYGDQPFTVTELKKDFGYRVWELWSERQKGYLVKVGTVSRGRGLWQFTPKAMKKIREQEKRE